MRFQTFLGFLVLAVCAILFPSCKSGNPTSAPITNIDSLYKLYPDSVPILIAHGNKMLERYDLNKAFQDGAKAYRLQPKNIEARFLYAQAMNNRPERTPTDVAAAQGHFKFVVQKEPRNLKALIQLATTYSQQGDYEKSFQYINEVLKIDKKYRDGYVLKGTNYLQLGKRDLAKSSYQTAIDQDPKFFEGIIFLGTLYQQDGDPLCIEYYTSALQLRPNSIDAMYNLAYGYQDLKRFDEAMIIYREMAIKDPEFSPSLFQQGSIKQSQNDIDSAQFFYNQTLQKEPRYVEAWHNLGMCYELKKDRSRALQAYAKALKYNPDFELSRNAADRLR